MQDRINQFHIVVMMQSAAPAPACKWQNGGLTLLYPYSSYPNVI